MTREQFIEFWEFKHEQPLGNLVVIPDDSPDGEGWIVVSASDPRAQR